MAVDGKQFRVGTARFPLRGVTYGSFRSREDGARFPEFEQVKRDFLAMRAADFTVVRTYTEPPDDLVELAADWGLRLLAGTFWPDWRYLVGASRRQAQRLAHDARATVRASARRLAGVDQVFALCLGNEVPADVVRWTGTRRVAALIDELVDVVRDEDPTRLVTYANYPTAEYLQLDSIDFLTCNVFLEGREEFRRYLSRLQHLAGDRPLVLGEIGLDAGTTRGGEQRQAETLDWQLATALDRGMAGSFVFSWTDDWWVADTPVEGWHFGLTRADRSPRPALDVASAWNRRTVADLNDDWPSMSVVVCAYNAAETLDECLRHACALDYPGLEVVVVDDGSTDDTAVIAGRYSQARLVRIPHSGLSVARNEGLRAARGEIVAYLDADAYPTSEWPYYLALGFDSRDVVATGGPNVPPASDPLGAQVVARSPGGPVHVLTADDRAEHVPGCNMAFWRYSLEGIGGFDPVYTAAGDDVDVCWKLLDRGGRIGFHPAALVWHHRRPGLRAYLRQQRGYGRAEALVEARHPDRFGPLGTARWQGRIYNSLVPPAGRQRVYRGLFGTAAYQSVYRGAGHGFDIAHQVAVPLAVPALAALPLAAASPVLATPAVVVGLVLLVLGVLDAVRVRPPRTLRRRRLRFRAAVAVHHLLQPLARRWGRARTEAHVRATASLHPPLTGPAQVVAGGVVLLPEDRPRADTVAAVSELFRRAGLRTVPAGEWDAHDVQLQGSVLVTGRLVTSAHPPGTVQLRVRRGLARGRALLVAASLAALAAVEVESAVALGVATAADVARGWWRTGPLVRRVVRRGAA